MVSPSPSVPVAVAVLVNGVVSVGWIVYWTVNAQVSPLSTYPSLSVSPLTYVAAPPRVSLTPVVLSTRTGVPSDAGSCVTVMSYVTVEPIAALVGPVLVTSSIGA